MRSRQLIFALSVPILRPAGALCLWRPHRPSHFPLCALSSEYFENDIVAVKVGAGAATTLRLCAVRPDGTLAPLCRRIDDVETDLLLDPREYRCSFWSDESVIHDDLVTNRYGEGFYGQRPVPSLGGGPGYGAEADEVWSVPADTLEKVEADGVSLPLIDMGIAHGEKARGGSF
jgi:hypothetical protein